MLPDLLISPTKIADSCSCMRRAVITQRVRGLSCKPNAAAALGNLKHQFIEVYSSLILSKLHQNLIEKYLENLHQLSSMDFESPEISKLVFETISDHIEELSCAEVTDEISYQELRCAVRSVYEWILSCTHSPTPRTPSLLRRTSSQVKYDLHLKEVLSKEETIWSPSLGLRGQIDLIVLGEISDTSHSNQKRYLNLIPIELKTGKWRLESLVGHRAQIILYVLMIMIRENISRLSNHYCSGLLLYLNSNPSETKWEVIQPTWGEIRALIQTRNILAYHIKESHSQV